jgi:glyoxylase-like metal-dependent hydrolase (beta-lactamase superfamily II)
MKRAVILTSIVGAGFVAAMLGAQPRGGGLPPIEKIQLVKGNLYKIFGAGGNTTVLVGSKGVVLVDTKLANNGQQILDQVRTVTDKPVTMVINTHVHPDHNGSNQFFKDKWANIDVVLQDNSAALVAKNKQSTDGQKPTKTFKDRLSLGAGKDRIDLYYFGAGHTNGDAWIVFPALRAMCIGDLMAWNMAPLIDPGSGGSVVALPDTLEKAVKGIKGVDLVIEGHGFVNSWANIVLYAKFNRDLLEESKKAMAAGGWPKDVLAVLKAKPEYKLLTQDKMLPGLEYGGTASGRVLINARVAFQELRGQPVTTNFAGFLPGEPGAPPPGTGGPGRGPGGGQRPAAPAASPPPPSGN